MPRAGGIFSLIPGYFAVDGTTIEVSQHNPVFEDMAQALTDSLPRDGSAPMTGNLAMGSNKITNLAAATNPADAVRFDQLPTVTPTTATLTAGTNAQGQGPITTDQVTITVAAANPSGATLPTAVAGKRVIIANRGANPVNIYPATGASIGALAANAPVLLAVNQSVEFFARSATQWEGQISQPLDATLTSLSALTLAKGDIFYATGADTLVNLAKGADGQVLTLASGVPAWSSPTGHVSLGTIATTSGASQSLTSLDLTPYKFLRIVISGTTASSTGDYTIDGGKIILSSPQAATAYYGIVDVDLATGVFGSTISRLAANGGTRGGDSSLTNASTSITLSVTSGAWTAGAARVYGVA